LNVAVVGSSGAMGSFFAKYFLSKGFNVTGYDHRRVELPGVEFKTTGSEAVKYADAVLIATPLEKTVDVCRELVPQVKRDSVLIDICSVKGKILPRIRRIVKGRGIHLLSIHPLFGPSLLLTGHPMKIAVIRDAQGDSTLLARKFFPDAELLSMTTAEHDRFMAVLLSLIHASNMALAKVAADWVGFENLSKLYTPTSYLQFVLSEAVLSQDPSLISSIQLENTDSPEVIAAFISELQDIFQMVREGRRDRLLKEIIDISRLCSVSRSSVKKLYKAYEALLSYSNS
jgi:prephenate dehydrogenase